MPGNMTALTPQAISRSLPSQNGTQANPATNRAKNTHSVVRVKAALRDGFAASFRTRSKLWVQVTYTPSACRMSLVASPDCKKTALMLSRSASDFFVIMLR